jgi:hypothetical protein
VSYLNQARQDYAFSLPGKAIMFRFDHKNGRSRVLIGRVLGITLGSHSDHGDIRITADLDSPIELNEKSYTPSDIVGMWATEEPKESGFSDQAHNWLLVLKGNLEVILPGAILDIGPQPQA